jgi:putative oxidoreductase
MYRNLSGLAGRLLLAALFLVDGRAIIANYGGTADYLAQNGVPPRLLPVALATILVGGLLIAAGCWTRAAALALGGFCISTALLFHLEFSDFNEQLHFWKDLAIAGGFLVLFAHGAGRFSVDHLLERIC